MPDRSVPAAGAGLTPSTLPLRRPRARDTARGRGARRDCRDPFPPPGATSLRRPRSRPDPRVRALRRCSSADARGRCGSRNARTCASGCAPTNSSTTRPLRKSLTAGMPRIWNCCARSWFSSVLTLTTLILPAFSSASCSSTGPSARQGPHHGAQKSTSTSWEAEALTTSAGKVAVVTAGTDAVIATLLGRTPANSIEFPS